MDDAEDILRGRWGELASYLGSLPEDSLAAFSDGAGVEFPGGPETVDDVLARVARSGASSPSDLLALAGQRAGVAGDTESALAFGRAALELADTGEEEAFARVCLAQTNFRGRRDPVKLAAFEEHCEAAVGLGHAGTFCYERLLVLYEYRGEIPRATALCRQAVEVLSGAGDETSAKRYREKLARLRRKRAPEEDEDTR